MIFAIKDCEQKVIEIDPHEGIEAILQYVEEKSNTKLPRSPHMNISINPQAQRIIITVTTDVTGAGIAVPEGFAH